MHLLVFNIRLYHDARSCECHILVYMWFKPSALDINAYLLTQWSRVLLEKLTGSAASQEISRIFGTRRFITVLTSARHLSLS